MDMAGGIHDPKWSLERRESSGFLVWRKDSPTSRIRFRFDVEVLEYEKHPNEDYDYNLDNSLKFRNLSATAMIYATCVAGIALTFYIPWYLIDKVV